MTDANELERIASRLESAGHWVSLDHRTDESGAAELIGIKPRSLRNWRAQGIGPAFVFAGRVTYKITAVLDYLNERENRMA